MCIRDRDSIVAGKYVYVADGQGGVMVLWFAPVTSGTIPPTGGTYISEVDGTTYVFPAGVFTDTIILTHVPVPGATVPDTGDLTGIEHFFDVTAVYSSTGLPAQLVPGTIFTISVAYADAEQGMVNADSLQLHHWNAVQWSTDGITKVEVGAENVVASQVNHLSLFGVLGSMRRVYLPLVLRH